MKKSAFYILFLCFVFEAAGQTYKPLVKENAQYFEHYLKLEQTIKVESAWNLKLSGDTLVNNKTYKKVYRRQMYSTDSLKYIYFPKAINPTEPSVLYALLREDTNARKVWGIVLDSNNSYSGPFPICGNYQEVLMYDFSLTVGDTMNMCMAGSSFKDTISDIRTDQNFNLNLKAFYSTPGIDVFYESIGSNTGLFNMEKTFLSGYSWELYDYCVGNDADCNVQYLDQPELKLSPFKVYPNPANEFLFLKSSQKNTTYGLFNSLGISCISGSFQASKKLDVRNLSPGIYFLVFDQTNAHKLIIH